MSGIREHIDWYFSRLSDFIEQLPVPKKVKKQIWLDCYIRFYDEPVITEDGGTTTGIHTEWQLKQFENQFNQRLQSIRLKAVESWTKNLISLEPAEAELKLNKLKFKLEQKQLLAEIGGKKLNEWEKWLQFYINHEERHLKVIHQDRGSTNPPSTTPIWWTGTEIQLKHLLSLLAQEGYIEFEGSLDKVIAQHFINKSKEPFYKSSNEAVQPIWWKRSNRLLLYLMLRLKAEGFIEKDSQENKLIKLHFINREKQAFTESLAQNKTVVLSYTVNNLPKNYTKIDEIISLIKLYH